MSNDYIAQGTARIQALRAVATNDLKFFIRPHLMFRAQIKFKTVTGKSQTPNQHRYGNEHACTLNQVRAGYVKTIKLDRSKGLQDLIKMIEISYKGKISAATVYMRENPGEPFDRIIRVYDDENKIKEDKMPDVIPGDVELFYNGMSEGLPLISDQQLPDFAKEISTNLQQQTLSSYATN